MATEKDIRTIVEAVLTELQTEGINGKGNDLGQVGKPGVDKKGMLPDIGNYSLKEKHFIPNPVNEEGLMEIKGTTPTRIGVWRAGPRYLTEPWLRFRADHAAARDAVHTEVDEELMEKMGFFCVQTVVQDKAEYLTRPDRGRILSEEAVKTIKDRCKMRPQVQVIVVDGLSSTAIEANVQDFYPALLEGLKNHGLEVGTTFYVKFGRVGVMDHIGEVLEPEVVVELVGERPGLVTAKSMSAYMCYRPNRQTIESDRSLVSNIHDGGIPPVEAGAHVADFAKRMFDAKASGIALAQKSG